MDAEIRFYRSEGQYDFLSNLYQRRMYFDERVFPCSEMAYQFGKPKDPAVAEWLVSAPKPRFCSVAAHALLPYDVSENWRDVKVQRMLEVLRVKFNQHPDLQARLLATGNAVLIEESKTDSFWGIGPSGDGKNMLGQLLMKVRAELLARSQESRSQESCMML